MFMEAFFWLVCLSTGGFWPSLRPEPVILRLNATQRDAPVRLAPTYDLEDDVPLTNIKAFFAACRQPG